MVWGFVVVVCCCIRGGGFGFGFVLWVIIIRKGFFKYKEIGDHMVIYLVGHLVNFALRLFLRCMIASISSSSSLNPSSKFILLD